MVRRAFHRDLTAHPLDDAPRDRKAETRTAELAAGAAFGLLELEEDAGLLLRRDPDAGVAHLEHDLAGRCARFDDDADAAHFRELDGVAGEIEQHLAQPRGVAHDALGQPLVDVGRDFETLGLGARTQQLDDLLDERQQRERPRLEIELAGFDLGEVEDVLDQRQQRIAGGLGGLEIGDLLGRQRRVEQQIGHAEDAVERRADLVRHHRKEARLGAVRRFRGVARLGEGVAGFGAVTGR